MWFTTRLRDRHSSARKHSRRSPAKPRAFRPRSELLEGRALLTTLTVTNTLDSGHGSLRFEIAHANKNAIIEFAPSLDGQTITLTSGELDITTGLTIQGPGAGQLTISGGKNSRVFDVNASAPVVLSGLTVTGGDGVASALLAYPYDGDGGGILNLSTLTLSGCVVSGNSVNGLGWSPELFGGGIYNAGTLTLTGCTISNNSAFGANVDFSSGYGGGIYNAGTLTVSTSTLSGNVAYNGFGGGILNAGTLTVSTSTFNSNFDDFGTYTEDDIYGTYHDGGGNSFS